MMRLEDIRLGIFRKLDIFLQRMPQEQNKRCVSKLHKTVLGTEVQKETDIPGIFDKE